MWREECVASLHRRYALETRTMYLHQVHVLVYRYLSPYSPLMLAVDPSGSVDQPPGQGAGRASCPAGWGPFPRKAYSTAENQAAKHSDTKTPPPAIAFKSSRVLLAVAPRLMACPVFLIRNSKK